MDNVAAAEDLAGSASRYHAVKALLRQKVLSGEVGHGERLAPELQLCQETNLSRTTMRRAIGELVDEGLLVRYRGKGTFVNFRRSKTQRRLLGAIILRNIHVHNSYDMLIDGARDAASKRGYKLVVADSRDDALTSLHKAISLNEIRAAGSLMVPIIGNTQATDRTLRALKAAGQKVVMVDSASTADDIPSVSSQNEEATFELTECLIQRGYRRIAFLTGELTGSVRERETGFLRAMSKHGLPVPSHYFLKVAGSNVAVQGIQEIDVLMAMRDVPQAVICLHDLIALNVLRRCRDKGWLVPHDIAVAGFDDLPEAALSAPPLTTVHQPMGDLGRRAVELLVRQLEGETLLSYRERLPCHIVVRESC